MSDDTPSPLNNVITIDDERIKSHLDRVVRGTVEETLNALLDAEADRLCNAQRMSAARRVGIRARRENTGRGIGPVHPKLRTFSRPYRKTKQSNLDRATRLPRR